MKNLWHFIIYSSLAPVLIHSVAADQSQATPARLHLQADQKWKFALGDPANAQAPGFNDAGWRILDLPHDWSIEGNFDSKCSTGGAEGFLPEGIGWYRYSFMVPANWQGRKVTIEFDGVYMNAQVWLNGVPLGSHPYGYTGFCLDLTPQLKFGGNNIVAVRVDNSEQKNSRWYSGSGIYRHVWITVTDPVHIPFGGVFVKTRSLSDQNALIDVATDISNETGTAADVTVQTAIFGPDGSRMAITESPATAPVKGAATVNQEITVPRPLPWSLETPREYHAVTRLSRGGNVIDQVDTPFGIRTLSWSSDKGLQLNGKTIKLAGGCIHEDNGCLGSACFDRAEERRVELLKGAGFNAIRTAHNPPSRALLDACDRLGVLVLDEAFDCWEKGKNGADYHLFFKDWWQKDINAMVLRDRNHPSVVMWSIGNEIPQQYDMDAPGIGGQLAGRIHSLDSSRPVTEAFCFRPRAEALPAWDRLCGCLDIVGYNYNIDRGRTEDHLRVPSRVMVCTETFPREAFSVWEQVRNNSYITGEFVWTAMDYLGENGIGRWEYGTPLERGHGRDALFPWHGAYCGDLDEIGTRKDCSHYRRILWDRGEKLYMTIRRPDDGAAKIWVQTWGSLSHVPNLELAGPRKPTDDRRNLFPVRCRAALSGWKADRGKTDHRKRAVPC